MALKLTIPLPPTFMDYPGDPKVRWNNWLAQLKNFFTLTDLTLPASQKLTDEAKNAYLSALLGTEGVRILMAHPVAATADTATFTDFSAAVSCLFERPVNPVRAEYEFRSRRQGPTESAADFLTALRTLYVDCATLCSNGAEAKKLEDHNLAMQLAIGCYSRKTQEKLLQLPDVDLNTFYSAMQADESALEASATIRTEAANRSVASVSHHEKRSAHPGGKNSKPSNIYDSFPRTPSSSTSSSSCIGCGSSSHRFKSRECPAHGKTCNYCRKLHHFASQCLSKGKNQGRSIKSLSRANLQVTRSGSSPLPEMEISVAVQCESHTAHVRFMVDSGADVTTLQQKLVQQCFPTAPLHRCQTTTRNYDGSPISGIQGFITCSLSYSGRTFTADVLVVPDELPNVIGRDSIQGLQLQIDGKNLTVSAVTTRAQSGDSALRNFPALASSDLGTFPDYTHAIAVSETYRPHVAKLRAVPLARRESVNAEIQHMVDAGIWSPIAKSDCAHAMVVVSKKDGGVRITSDLSPLNSHIIPDRHPLPLLEDLLLQLRGASFFSKIDLRKGYYHIPLHEDSRRFTTTITPLGLMAYNRLPMGLRDAASVFQKCVFETLKTCENTIAFIDDILVFGKTREEHDNALESVLHALSAKQFRINREKCEIGVSATTFLGFRIDVDGVRPNPDKVKPIKEAPRPTTLKQLQSFLGAVNYLSNFIPHLADSAEPLRRLTRKNQPFVWGTDQDHAFQVVKDSIYNEVTLSIFDPHASTIVTVDASDIGLGAQLSQIQRNVEVPIQFASHTLSDRERNYATNEREGLACLWAVEHWEKFLLGRHFTLRTDHGALSSLLQHHTATRKSAKFVRWLERLQRFDYSIEYIKGSRNCVADALSRLPQPNSTRTDAIQGDEQCLLTTTIASISSGPISIDSLRRHTADDSLLQEVIQHTTSSWPQKKHLSDRILPFHHVRHDLTFDNGLLARSDTRLVVPAAMRKTILKVAHTGHPGIVRAKRQLRRVYWWPGMDSDIENLVRYCTACGDSSKSHKPTVVPPVKIELPSEPWHKIGIDITGPFANAPQHQRFLTVVVDYKSGFPEVLLSGDITSTKIISWLRELFARYGNPAILVSDNGRQFCSDQFEQFIQQRDILHWKTPVYDPRPNGKVEAFNRFLKHGIQTFFASRKEFATGIQELLLSYRSTSATPDGDTPAEQFLHRRIRTDYEPASRTPATTPQPHPDDQLLSEDQSASPHPPRFRGPYRVNDMVRVRIPHVPKGLSPFSEPRRIVSVCGNYTYLLSDGQRWNARRLVRHREEPRSIVVERDDEVKNRPRRSSRKSRGLPPIRYPHGIRGGR